MTKHPRLSLILVLLAAALLGGCAGSHGGVRPVIGLDGKQYDVQDPVENGRVLVMTGQYGLAVDALARVLHSEPRNVRALTLMAEAYARLRRYDLADRYHQQALAIDPESVVALNNLAFSYLERGDRSRAADLLQQAAAVDGDQPVVKANLRLASGSARSTAGTAEPSVPAIGVTREVPLSRHVVLVRRAGKLVRLAPGVQLLVTQEAPGAESQPPVSRQLEEPNPAPLPYLTQHAPAGDDSRAKVLAALQRLLDPSPFGFFPEVDDFGQMWRAGTGVAQGPGASIPQSAS